MITEPDDLLFRWKTVVFLLHYIYLTTLVSATVLMLTVCDKLKDEFLFSAREMSFCLVQTSIFF